MLEYVFYIWKYYDYITAIRTLYKGYHYYNDVKSVITYCIPPKKIPLYDNEDIEMEILNEGGDKWCCVSIL
jgi:hypothetical protein